MGVTDAEFEAARLDLFSSTAGGAALVRHLFDDIGRTDAEGRPEKGVSLWWFIAAMEPGATHISGQREELVQALRRGGFGTEEVVRLANAWLGDCASLMKNDRHAPEADRAKVMKMIMAAKQGLDAWAKDKTFVGNDYFMARLPGGKEMVSDDFNAGGINYATKDDAWVQNNYPLASRPRGGQAPARPSAPAPRPTAPAAPPATESKIAGLAQSDAVKALLAADVAESLSGSKVPEGLIGGLVGAAADEVAKLHGVPEAKLALFRKAVGGAAEEYNQLGVAEAKAKANEILTGLGISTKDVRAFRQGVATGLVSAATTSVAAPAGNVPFPRVRAELEAIADRLVAKGSVDASDVEEIRRFTAKLDLATIREGSPDYIWLMQKICPLTVTNPNADLGPGERYDTTPEGADLEAIYYNALHTNEELVAKRSRDRGYLPADDVRKQFIEWYDNPPDAAAVRALLEKTDPSDMRKDVGWYTSSVGILALRLHERDDAAASAYREPLWAFIHEKAGE